VREQVLRPLGMADTGFGYAGTGTCRAAVGYQRLPRVLTPVLRAALPAGIVAGRQGGYVSYRPFHVIGAVVGGSTGAPLMPEPPMSTPTTRPVCFRDRPSGVGH